MTKKKIFIVSSIIASALIVGLLGSLWYVARYTPSIIRANESGRSEVGLPYQRQLDGQWVATAPEVSAAAVGVAVDNHPDAWPQSGLQAARVVYEAPVEGSLTRLLALYPASSTVELAGPVRSARPYFIDWLAEYGNALYLHSGGSPEALRRLKTERTVFDINEFSWGEYFWRSPQATPPHNLFTSSSRWQAILGEYRPRRPERPWEGWRFASDANQITSEVSTNTRAVAALVIPYAPDYRVEWRSAAEAKQWKRWVNGVLALDAVGEPVIADNVVIQYVPLRVVDEEGRLVITTIGSGEARLLQRGKLISGAWRKDNITARTRFYHTDGREMILAPGITWVQVAPSGLTLEITN